MLSALKRTSKKTVDLGEKTRCTLCDKTTTLRALQKHMGGHQQQLALFALPANLEEAEDDLDEDTGSVIVRLGNHHDESLSDLSDGSATQDANEDGIDATQDYDALPLADENVYQTGPDDNSHYSAGYESHDVRIVHYLLYNEDLTAQQQEGQQRHRERRIARLEVEESEREEAAAIEEANKLRPSDAPKLPIKFRDAIGRKFAFPWYICKTWKVRIYIAAVLSKLTLFREWKNLSNKPFFE
jgi:hypothetical protein